MEVITGILLKQYIEDKYGIPMKFLRARVNGNYASVMIVPDKSKGNELNYSYQFPKELGNTCMSVVYKDSEKLASQDWGGNICAHSIAMYQREWREVMQKLAPLVIAS